MASFHRKPIGLMTLLLTVLLLTGCGNSSTAQETNGDIFTIPETTEAPSPMELEVDRVVRQVNSLQTDNSISFLAFADTHTSEETMSANILAGEASAAIRSSVDIDFAALLGGIIPEGLPQSAAEVSQAEVVTGYLAEAFSGIPNFVALGEQDTFPIFPVNNPSQTYYSQDLAEHKLRVIVLNTSDTDSEYSIGMSAQQLQWFAESLDLSGKTDAESWGILIFSHIPLDFSDLFIPAGQILDAYLTGSTLEFTQDEQTVSYSFEGKNAAEIIANIHGHTHNFLADNLYLVNQKTGMYRSPIVRICVPNTGGTDRNPYGSNDATDSNGIEYGERQTCETEQIDTSFQIITVDRDQKIIHCTAFGAGHDRKIPYAQGLLSETPASGTTAPEGTYTNQVPLSTEFGLRNTTVFNETGYRNHTYLLCNNIDEESWPYGHDAEYVTTGAIPFTVPSYRTPPVVYIWGATLDEDDHTRFFIYDSQKYRLVLQATGSEFRNYFTIDQLGDQYYRLTPIPDGKDSMLFPATNGRAGRGSIAFSLKGTGENLVITVGEPIIPEATDPTISE